MSRLPNTHPLFLGFAATLFFSAAGVADDCTPETLIRPTGEAANHEFGAAVAYVGDLDGDGFGDMLVGVPLYDAPGANQQGRVYLYRGSSAPDSIADLILDGEAVGDYFGQAISAAGDFDGDDFPDLIVGAYRSDSGGVDAGRAYVFRGGPGVDTVPDWIFTGGSDGDYFGFAAAGAGDVNHDGYDDVIVGAYLDDAGGPSDDDRGRAYIFYGGPGADTTPDLVLTGEVAGDQFGIAVAGAGDLNGDGHDDVVVGAFRSDAAGTQAGRAYVYFGGPAVDTVPDLLLDGEAAGVNFGYALGPAGDVNGDGEDDLIVGAFRFASSRGRAYVYFGGAGVDSLADWTLTGLGAGDSFGQSVSGAGDVNGDGYDDVIVGANFADSGGFNSGAAYVFFGGASPDTISDVTLDGEAANDEFGRAVGGGGDFDGDAHADVIVGAWFNDAGGNYAGRAYVVAPCPTQGVGVGGWALGGLALALLAVGMRATPRRRVMAPVPRA